MSYQVLARKWRPQTFHQLVGQEHVKQALVNALNEQRLHHAYLFTGTRGVGKTTIARIFAKSLNCDQGISAQPCGQCATCLDIEAGKYIDLIEIDAASRTKVEDTREILDNVQYAPTRGQFKVYLIDEVHMLSKHSFNALLKTLEEPPEHVKFLLATTDPQKLPVTILSRCLQFNLSALSVNQISTQLENILGQEHIHYEPSALEVLAKAADGSMRDALSLTDQAIAQTNAQLNEPTVKDMLGLMDVRFAQQLLSAVLLQDGEELMQQTRSLATRNPNYLAVLDDLLNLTHSIQLTQLVPSAAALSERDCDYVKEVAQSAKPQHIHLIYQLLLSGKRDLQWASSAHIGFEMLMLRLLAFEPVSEQTSAPATPMASANERSQERAANLRAMLARNNNALSEQGAQTQEPAQSLQQTSDVPAQSKDEAPEPKIAYAPIDEPQPQLVTIEETLRDMDAESQAQQTSASEQGEQEAAVQFDAVMRQAQDLGYEQGTQHVASESQPSAAEELSQTNEHVSVEEPLEVDSSLAPAQQLDELERQTQSAIARILQNRKLGTASKPSQPSGEPKKTQARGERAELSAPQSQQHAQAKPELALVDEAYELSAEPAPEPSGGPSAEPLNQPAATSQAVRQMPSKQRSMSPAERLLERHQPDPQKLAPELLVQLEAPTTSEVAKEPELNIPVPQGFVSPVSEIKFAHQQDAWAKLIEDMNLGGRTRQFALHSMFKQEPGNVHLAVHQEQQHLDGAALRDRIAECLSEQLGEPITLHVDFVTQVENTPYLIQQQIDQLRLSQAVQAVNDDANVQRLTAQFSAILDENSVQPL
ncbi:DNA polymerase III subunit gamma/tau [Pseudoalteromonas sp. SSDWG2]|uniref:DNA polymerase III subunit gamma/tau n=1 Tax=Pseudoalteromonas sp. SSDWG2 TaxID=3139391 RepID=UPI003BAD1F1B